MQENIPHLRQKMNRYIESEEICNELLRVIGEAECKLEYVGEGRNRRVYALDSDFIIKIPVSEEGFLDNVREARTYTRYPDDNFAFSEFVLFAGLQVLKMERLTTEVVKGYAELPDWVASIDCGQVGYNKQGKLLVYDYA